MWCRGIRGATTVEGNAKEDIIQATKELLQKLVEVNGVKVEEIACVILTTTPDLDAEFPAAAARELGWSQVALLCGHEMNVPGSLPRCLGMLLLWNTEKTADEIVHMYLRGAKELRANSTSVKP
jgi:chorismate mutase